MIFNFQGCETKLAKFGDSTRSLVQDLRTFITANHAPSTSVVLN